MPTKKVGERDSSNSRKWESINVSKEDLKACEEAIKFIAEGNPEAAVLMGKLSKTDIVSYFVNEGINSVRTKAKGRR